MQLLLLYAPLVRWDARSVCNNLKNKALTEAQSTQVMKACLHRQLSMTHGCNMVNVKYGDVNIQNTKSRRHLDTPCTFVNCPTHPQKGSSVRLTRGTDVDGPNFTIFDNWRSHTNARRDMLHAWTGTTTFSEYTCDDVDHHTLSTCSAATQR